MVELFRTADSPLADEIVEALRDMVIAHRVHVVADGDTVPGGGGLPVLRHDGDVVSGEAPLRAYVETLRRLMDDWGRFQSDSCYVGPDGRTC